MSDLKSMDNVGVQFVNVLLGRGTVNGVVNLQFGTYQFTPSGDQILPDLAVSCRLRMDTECAQQLYEQLGELIRIGATLQTEGVAAGEKPN